MNNHSQTPFRPPASSGQTTGVVVTNAAVPGQTGVVVTNAAVPGQTTGANPDASFEAYFTLLDQIGTVLEELTVIAREKNQAVRKDDLITLNDCIKREQIAGMKLRGLDQKRAKMLRALGLDGVRLSGLAEHCPVEIRPRARDAAEKLRRQCGLYRSAADSARVTLEMNLHQIEKIIETRYHGAVLPDGEIIGDGGAAGGSFTDFRA